MASLLSARLSSRFTLLQRTSQLIRTQHYNWIQYNTMTTTIDTNQSYQFGRFKLSPAQVFYTSPSKLTYCSVNLKPIVPGHILVIPYNNADRLVKLSTDEINDLFNTAVYIAQVLEYNMSTTAYNLGIQDGIDAGQSVPHVHIHILPRKKNDVENNDDIYDAIDNNEAQLSHTIEHSAQQISQSNELKVDDASRKPRTSDEMAAEANQYRQWIQQYQVTHKQNNTKSSI